MEFHACKRYNKNCYAFQRYDVAGNSSHEVIRCFRKASESMMDPLVIIQLWDKNKFRKDEMLGQMVMDITHFKGDGYPYYSQPFSW